MERNAVIPFLLVSLAVFRVSVMVSSEDGPFYIFSSWRKKLMDWERKRGRPHWIIDGFHCPLCVAWWLGFIGALVVPFTSWYDYLVIAIAISGVTLILRRRIV